MVTGSSFFLIVDKSNDCRAAPSYALWEEHNLSVLSWSSQAVWGEIPLGVYASCISPPNDSSWCFHSVTLLGQITYAAWGRASNQEGGFSEESARALNRIVWWEVGKAWRLFDMLLSICGTVSFWFSLFFSLFFLAYGWWVGSSCWTGPPGGSGGGEAPSVAVATALRLPFRWN